MWARISWEDIVMYMGVKFCWKDWWHLKEPANIGDSSLKSVGKDSYEQRWAQ